MIFSSAIVFSVLILISKSLCDLQCKNSTNVVKLVIDHDGEADDSMAIFIALLYEKHFNGPQVVGIMTSHGNIGEEQAFKNTQRILSVANRQDIPIFRGSNRSLIEESMPDGFFGKDGLGETSYFNEYKNIAAQSEHASVALIRLSKEFEGDLTVLALGTLTNTALAVMMDSQFIARLDKLTIAAGNINGKEFPDPELNALMDVEAYHIVIKNSLPDIVMVVPYSQSLLNIPKDWRQNVLGALDTQIMQAQNSFEAYSMKNYATHAWVRLPPLAAALTLDGNIIKEAYYSHNDIVLCGDDRGINTNRFEVSDCNVEILKVADEENFKKFLVDVFSSEMFCYNFNQN